MPPLWLTTNLFRHCARISAGWRLSPYPAYERLQYQTVMQLSVGPRKRMDCTPKVGHPTE
ncbi:hypothetical protein E3AUHO_49010 [Klebsiella pneumoniae subsp. pneumoniae]|nr:hypothetical protein E3AUHO_49010 [Klebsiella pneumoniae subsp. pneumoniae]BDS95742.1 hypothetical protein Kpn21f22_34040 [Klebsiella pneumoniae]BDT00718.1 hypothetical protein Kpn21rf22_33860 [Klebsiella pneumoniae]GHK14259.1 hypothetical protein KPZU02_32180 [Klebsiella pneumoniae]GKJ99538.1 hypothetical protein NUBL9661_28980 [Klebsiella pneumoniae]